MSSLKLVDRIAILSMLSVSMLIPVAAVACADVNDADLAKIRVGMPANEVIASIGQPFGKMRFPATKTTAWDYHFRDPWNYDSEFSVIVDDAGVVVGTFSVRNGE